nr:hypothetical protein [Tanacetum cinerariifolium]
MTNFLNWYCRQLNKTVLTPADLDGQAYEVVKEFYPDVILLQFQMEECHKMLIDQVDWTNLEGDQVRVDYLRYGSKGSNPALSISKMKAARYPDFGLELLMPKKMLIDDVFTYDISAKYGISHCVVRIKANSRYGYDYLSEIILRRADLQEHTIAEKDFKNLYPSDFEDLNLLLLQGYLDHLHGSDKRMLSTAVKIWTRNLVIRQRVKDFQIDEFMILTTDFFKEQNDSVILVKSVVRIKANSRYGYDYLSEIILRRADLQEHTIAEKDFKNLYPSDFEDLNLLLLQGYLDHLHGSDKRMLSTAVKIWTRNLVIRQRVKDFQIGIKSYQTQLNLTKPG